MHPRHLPQFALALVAILSLVLLTWGFARPAHAGHSDTTCNNCHVAHGGGGDGSANINSQVPLWNPANAGTILTGSYTSLSMNATTGGPDGASKLCLSCHDGTYDMPNSHKFGADPETGMGTLENSHPISFVYDLQLAENDGALVDPGTLGPDVLDGNGKLQCTSCHDVHQQAVDKAKYLRWSEYDPEGEGSSSGFCNNCHMK